MAHKLEEKEKEKVFVVHVRKDHQFWSTRDGDEETDHKGSQGNHVLLRRKETTSKTVR